MGTTKLTRSIEEELILNLVKQIKGSGKSYTCIVVRGRGGLSIAQKIAYKLNIKEVTFGEMTSTEGGLFVDDISCTGETLKKYRCDTATLVYRTTSKVKPTFFALEVNSANYIKFSWEN